jgi:tryptophan synthase alpha chain
MTGNRIAARFAALRDRGEKGLVVYLTAFDPDRERSELALLQAARGGADLLEIGVPWSDPSADGPVIQRAMLRGLESGASLAGTLELCARLRRQIAIPLVLFGYYNPILCFGPARLCRAAREAGVDGVLCVDLPPEESAELDAALHDEGLCRVPLLAPTTSPERAARVVSGPACTGFAYYVALTGVTGAGHLDLADVGRHLAALRQQVQLPLAVGFGVKDPETVRGLAELPGCDAVVVGSAVVQAVERGADIEAFVRRLKEGTRG